MSKATPGRPLGRHGGNHMANMATGSSIAYRLGLEQFQEAADFWRAFSGAGFGVRGVRPECRMEHLAGDHQCPNLLGSI